MVRFNASETNPNGGGMLPKGKHHVFISTAVGTTSQKGDPQLQVKFDECPHTADAVSGRSIRTFIPLTGKGMGKLGNLLIAVNAWTKEDWEKSQKAGADMSFDESLLVGRQLVVDVEEQSYNNETKLQVGFGMFAVTDPRAKGVKLSPLYLEMLKTSPQNLIPTTIAENSDAAGELEAAF